MNTLTEETPARLKRAQELLAPYAVPLNGYAGRVHPDEEHGVRFAFQRDRDRIINAQAFRRLQGKTQVFVSGGDDHFRTRLTHTMEVTQVARNIARTLSLNEDLAECIALAHDLGHPPFGHAGEAALNAWLRDHGLHFEHNEQSYRLVTLLEQHSDRYTGLNLNKEVLAGLLKHTSPHERPPAISTPSSPLISLEAYIVNLADEIAYTAHDCEDGIRAKLFSAEDLHHLSLFKEAHEEASRRSTPLRGAIIRLLVKDAYAMAREFIAEHAILKREDLIGLPAFDFSPAIRSDLRSLRSFLWDNMYSHPDVAMPTERGTQCIRTLCDLYLKNPPYKVLVLQERTKSSLVEAIKDYVAGMTDAFAMKLAKADQQAVGGTVFCGI